jgi:hypothetical protein
MDTEHHRAEWCGVAGLERPRHESAERFDPALPCCLLGQWCGIPLVPPSVDDDAPPIERSINFIDLERNPAVVRD